MILDDGTTLTGHAHDADCAYCTECGCCAESWDGLCACPACDCGAST